MTSLLNRRIHAFIYEGSYHGVSKADVEKCFPFNPEQVEEEFQNLLEAGHIYISEFEPTEKYRSLSYMIEEEQGELRCQDCGSLEHRGCHETDLYNSQRRDR